MTFDIRIGSKSGFGGGLAAFLHRLEAVPLRVGGVLHFLGKIFALLGIVLSALDLIVKFNLHFADAVPLFVGGFMLLAAQVITHFSPLFCLMPLAEYYLRQEFAPPLPDEEMHPVKVSLERQRLTFYQKPMAEDYGCLYLGAEGVRLVCYNFMFKAGYRELGAGRPAQSDDLRNDPTGARLLFAEGGKKLAVAVWGLHYISQSGRRRLGRRLFEEIHMRIEHARAREKACLTSL